MFAILIERPRLLEIKMPDPSEEAKRFFDKEPHASELEAEQYFEKIDSDWMFVEKATTAFLKLQRMHRADRFTGPSQLESDVKRIWSNDR